MRGIFEQIEQRESAKLIPCELCLNFLYIVPPEQRITKRKTFSWSEMRSGTRMKVKGEYCVQFWATR